MVVVVIVIVIVVKIIVVVVVILVGNQEEEEEEEEDTFSAQLGGGTKELPEPEPCDSGSQLLRFVCGGGEGGEGGSQQSHAPPPRVWLTCASAQLRLLAQLRGVALALRRLLVLRLGVPARRAGGRALLHHQVRTQSLGAMTAHEGALGQGARMPGHEPDPRTSCAHAHGIVRDRDARADVAGTWATSTS